MGRRKKRQSVDKRILLHNQPYLVIDVETGGLSPDEDSLIEVSYAIVVNGLIPTRRQLYMYDRKTITEKALEVNGLKREQIHTFGSPREAIEIMKTDTTEISLLYDPKEGLIPVGHNVSFDFGFLRQWFWDMGDIEYWDLNIHTKRVIDTRDLAGTARKEGVIETENDKLTTVASYFGVLREHAHTGSVDVEMTIDVWERLMLSFLQLNQLHKESVT